MTTNSFYIDISSTHHCSLIHIWQAACRVWVHKNGKAEDPEFAQQSVKPENAKSTDLMLAKWSSDGAVWEIPCLTVAQFDMRNAGSDGSTGGHTTSVYFAQSLRLVCDEFCAEFAYIYWQFYCLCIYIFTVYLLSSYCPVCVLLAFRPIAFSLCLGPFSLVFDKLCVIFLYVIWYMLCGYSLNFTCYISIRSCYI